MTRSRSRIQALAAYLADHADAGDVIPGAGGARKLRWAAKGKGKRGGARIIYVYVVIAASADEKKELRQIAASLKGAQ